MRQLRGGLAIGILALAFLFVPAAQAEQAAVSTSASAFVDDLATRAFDVLRDESLSIEERDNTFREMFLAGFDVPRIGRSVLGRHWRRASDAQRREYLDLFENYMLATYSSRLGGFSDYRIQVNAERIFPNGRAVVASEIIQPDGGEPFRIEWGIRIDDNGVHKIVDVKIEGISMTVAQREEFGSVITNNGNTLDALLDILRQRVDTWEEQLEAG